MGVKILKSKNCLAVIPLCFVIPFFGILFLGCGKKEAPITTPTDKDKPLPVKVWQKTYGGSSDEMAYSVQQTQDGGYIVAGRTRPVGAVADFYILKLNSDGNKVWEKTYGGRGDEVAYSIQQTHDGGYIVAGKVDFYILKLDSDLQQEHPLVPPAFEEQADFYILKLDSNGNKVWEKTYGRNEVDEAFFSIQQTQDGGYIVAGQTRPVGAVADFYILKLNSDGNKVWEKTYGGSDHDEAFSSQQTQDGGYIVAGYTYSFGAGWSDFYILKLDSDGNKVWEKTYGGRGNEYAHSIQQTHDGGYIVAGTTSSFGAGSVDFYILKLDSDGNKVWKKTYGGNEWDIAYSLQQTHDGGYIVAGYTTSFSAGESDFYILKLDSDGNKVWEKTYGGSEWEKARSIQQTQDGGYIAGGGTNSFGAGAGDIYIIKTDKYGNTGPYPTKTKFKKDIR